MTGDRHGLTRREMLSLLAKGALTYPLSASALRALALRPSQAVPPDWRLTSEELLEEIVSRGFLFFWNEASKHTGLVRDRALADGGPDKRRIASIAATGFGLSALVHRPQATYLPSHQIGTRVVATLSFLLNHVEQVNGVFYHFIDVNTGKRVRMSEVSPIDTTILLCGVLTARAYFRDPVISRLATNIYAPRELALDAEWRKDLRPELDAGIQVHRRALGHLLRTHDDVPAGHCSAHL